MLRQKFDAGWHESGSTIASRDSVVQTERRKAVFDYASADPDVTGLATMFEGFLLGLSIQALDGATPDCPDAAVTSALTAWDAYQVQSRPSEKR